MLGRICICALEFIALLSASLHKHLQFANSGSVSAPASAREGKYPRHILLYERLQERDTSANDSAVELDCRENARFGHVVSRVRITDHTVDIYNADSGYDDHSVEAVSTQRETAHQLGMLTQIPERTPNPVIPFV